MKVIIDTNILISSLVFDNVIEKLLLWCLEDYNVELFCSTAIWLEIESKFLGGRVQKIAQKSKRSINQNHITEFISLLKNALIFVDQL
jgi:predicted nucleic acid-binding protein